MRKTCRFCKKPFKCTDGTRKYCTHKCAMAGQDRTKSKVLKPRQCAHCGKRFQPELARTRFCSQQCAYAARPAAIIIREPKTCPACSKQFVARHNNSQIHCSVKCSGRAKRLAALQRSSPTLHVVDIERLRHTAMRLLKHGRTKLNDLADQLDLSPKRARELVDSLKADNFILDEDTSGVQLAGLPVTREQGEHLVINVNEFFGKRPLFGALGDTHLGSKWERLDVLNALYDLYEREGITTVYHTGNIVEGQSKLNQFDIKIYGLNGQVDYCIANYPQRKGIKTHFITGLDHEGWWIQREGIDFGRHLADAARKAGRNDLIYIGHLEVDIALKTKGGSAVMRLMHPGGGSAYAVSYTVQKLVESWQGGEKPQVLLCGHYHKAEYGYPREVHCVQTGTCQDQSSFMRRLKLQAHVGGFIIEINQAETGEINRFKPEFIPFYDRGFYQAKYKV